VSNIHRKLTMEEKMINSFLIFLTNATSINQLKPGLLRLSTIRILPKAVAHKKKAMYGGAFIFHMLFQGNERGSSLLGEVNIM
jgi:hypothetical protein